MRMWRSTWGDESLSKRFLRFSIRILKNVYMPLCSYCYEVSAPECGTDFKGINIASILIAQFRQSDKISNLQEVLEPTIGTGTICRIWPLKNRRPYIVFLRSF